MSRHDDTTPPDEPRPYVFLSYSRADRAFAERLASDLQRAGVPVWRDVEQIAAGENWQRSIARGLSGGSALLYLASANATTSKWMDAELDAILGRGRPVIPLILDDAGALGLPPSLRSIQWLDFRSDYQHALDALVGAVPALVRKTRPVESHEQLSKGYVFISYADEDAEFVSGLTRFLGDHGYAYWDYRESERDYGSPLFADELENVIGESIATLSVLSPSWKRSTLARQEYLFSQEIGHPVFLLRFKPLAPTLLITGVNYIDFVTDEDAGFRKLDRELKRKGL